MIAIASLKVLGGNFSIMESVYSHYSGLNFIIIIIGHNYIAAYSDLQQ